MSKLQPLRLALYISAVLIGYVAVLLSVAGYHESSVRAVVRLTAQVSVVLFCGAFMAAPLQSLARGRVGAWLLVRRRALGIALGIAFSFHLLALAALATSFPHPFVDDLNAVTIVGGGLASSLILAMLLTSSDAAQNLLGMRNWRRLHTFGSYFAWVVFTQSYVGRVSKNLSYLPFVLLLLGTFVLRVARIIKRRSSPGRVSGTREVPVA